MTIRQLWVRVKALPWESPLWIAWRQEQEKAEERSKLEDVESALVMFGRPDEGG